MIFLDELREFGDDITADEKADIIREYLKEMKDAYEVCFHKYEKEIKEKSDEITGLENKISALQTLITDLESRVAELE